MQSPPPSSDSAIPAARDDEEMQESSTNDGAGEQKTLPDPRFDSSPPQNLVQALSSSSDHATPAAHGDEETSPPNSLIPASAPSVKGLSAALSKSESSKGTSRQGNSGRSSSEQPLSQSSSASTSKAKGKNKNKNKPPTETTEWEDIIILGHRNYPIKNKDIARLSPKEKLNDVIVNHYLQ